MRIDLDPADLFVLAGFAPPHRIPSHKKSLIAGETFDQAIPRKPPSLLFRVAVKRHPAQTM